MTTFKRRAPTPASTRAMTLYIFRSQKNSEINGFAATPKGEALPGKFGPWTLTETILPSRALPHGLNRAQAEKGVIDNGYQLWRMKPSSE
jgi:hypothetical protein